MSKNPFLYNYHVQNFSRYPPIIYLLFHLVYIQSPELQNGVTGAYNPNNPPSSSLLYMDYMNHVREFYTPPPKTFLTLSSTSKTALYL